MASWAEWTLDGGWNGFYGHEEASLHILCCLWNALIYFPGHKLFIQMLTQSLRSLCLNPSFCLHPFIPLCLSCSGAGGHVDVCSGEGTDPGSDTGCHPAHPTPQISSMYLHYSHMFTSNITHSFKEWSTFQNLCKLFSKGHLGSLSLNQMLAHSESLHWLLQNLAQFQIIEHCCSSIEL